MSTEPEKGRIFNPDARINIGTEMSSITIPAISFLSVENAKLRVIVEEARKKMQIVSSNFCMIGASSSRLENAKHEIYLQLLVNEALSILNSERVSKIEDEIGGVSL